MQTGASLIFHLGKYRTSTALSLMSMCLLARHSPQLLCSTRLLLFWAAKKSEQGFGLRVEFRETKANIRQQTANVNILKTDFLERENIISANQGFCLLCDIKTQHQC